MTIAQTLDQMAGNARPIQRAAAAPDASGPFNIEAEQAVLGAMLINNAVIGNVLGFLKAEHFFEELHQRIFHVATELFQSGKVASPITLKTYLGDHDLGPDMPTIPQYMALLASSATTVILAPDYARMVVDLAARRDLLRVTGEIARGAQFASIETSASLLYEHAQTLIAESGNNITLEEKKPSVGSAIGTLINDAIDRRQGNAPPIPSSGFADLDYAIGGGLRPGRLIVIAGRPGMGKSVIMVSSAEAVSRKGFGALINSLELDDAELSARLAAKIMARSSFPLTYSDILTGNLADEDIERLRDVRSRVESYPLSIDCGAGISIAQIEARAKRTQDRLARKGSSLSVLYVDYLGLVAASDRYKGRKVDETGEIALGAKNIAKRLGVCVVLFSQLSRAVESRDDKRPIMSDLRDSGNIEEHADVVGLLYRPAYYDAQDKDVRNGLPEALERAEERRNDLELILGKNRLGPTKTIHLYSDVAKSYAGNKAR